MVRSSGFAGTEEPVVSARPAAVAVAMRAASASTIVLFNMRIASLPTQAIKNVHGPVSVPWQFLRCVLGPLDRARRLLVKPTGDRPQSLPPDPGKTTGV
jgi:hypothetical protein